MLQSTRDFIHKAVAAEVKKVLSTKASFDRVEDIASKVGLIEDELRHRKQFAERQRIKKAPFPERANDIWGPLKLTNQITPSTQRRVIMLPVLVQGVRKPGTLIRHDMAFITNTWEGSPDPKVTIFHGNKKQDVSLLELANRYDYYYLAVSE